MTTPQADIIGDGPIRVVIVHGILGSGRNWRTFCRRLSRQRPDLSLHLPDLRNHGHAPKSLPPHTLASCVEDLAGEGRADVVIGHSFGGKVALRWAQTHPGDLAQIIVLDAPPGASAAHGDDSALSVIQALRAVQVPAVDRESVRSSLLAAGLSPAIASWLLTSLRREAPDGGWTWVYNVDGVEQMIRDYFAADFWPWLASLRGPPTVDVVRAQNSDRWTRADRTRLATLAAEGRLRVHELADAGHWLHVDNPAGLLSLLETTIHRG